MGTRDDEFMKKLFEAFKVESEEHLRVIGNCLLELEKDPGEEEKTEIIETMYREAHSLKGAARSVNLKEIESICQSVEAVFAALKGERIETSTELFDTLLRATDAMEQLVSGQEDVRVQPLVEQLNELSADATGRVSTHSGKGPEPAQEHPQPPTELDEADRGVSHESTDEAVSEEEVPEVEPYRPSPIPNRDRNSGSETIRIAVDKLDPLLRQAGEMVAVKLTAEQRLADLSELLTTLEKWRQKWTSVSSHDRAIGKLLLTRNRGAVSEADGDQVQKLVEFLEWNEGLVKSLETKVKEIARSTEADSRVHGGMVDDLLDDMMNVMMLPCSSYLDIVPKMVRDLSRHGGKEVYLAVEGADLEIDRRILDEMKDPLIHLVRNSIDHGIETPDERERKGKPRQGEVTISIAQLSGSQIEMNVSDDGAGIDSATVVEAAAKRGILSQDETTDLEATDALSLVFRSEVSTSSVVSTISGRGLGLAIVREKVENLGGHVSVVTTPDVGTSFRVVLPVTLSTFRGILVEVSDRLFVLPTANVERVARIKKDLIKTVGNRDTIEVDGVTVPLVRLADVLELPNVEDKNGSSPLLPVIMLNAGTGLVSFSVDAIAQEQEVLVKFLGKQLSRVRNVAGATVLGSGKLAPILSATDLIKSAIKSAFTGARPGKPVERLESRTKNILVVEDSITSRMLLKNILETSGYGVTTSVDGVEAMTALKSQDFDLVVSDVQMPRMDGFELTASIRSDEKLKDLPVVLVTSLGSREHRERGIEVGANAYINKGGFDQNDLLQTLARLI